MTSALQVEREGAVLRLTIDRDHRRNALDSATSYALHDAITQAERDDGVRAIILTAVGDKCFCSGMDMKEAAEIGVGHGLVPGAGFGGITERKRTKPLIAAVNGFAVAGGMEICLACDIVIAAEHAQFGLAEIKRGLFPFAGGVQRLAYKVPRQAGLAMILMGDVCPAERMVQLGLVTEIVPFAELQTRAMAVAQAIAGYSPAAVRNAMMLYDMAADSPLDQSMRFGRAFGELTLGDADSREGVAAFAGGRQAEYGKG